MTRKIIVRVIAAVVALAPAVTFDPTTGPVIWHDAWQGTTQEQTWDCLLDLGYRGRPGDHAEALYPTQRDLARCQH